MTTPVKGGTSYLVTGIIAMFAAGVAAVTATVITATNMILVESAAPALSASGKATVYADSTSHTLKVSQNGGAYANLGGASFDNPTATVSGSATNGVATTAMRSDAAPALAATAVTPASYTTANITVDQQGRLTAASTPTAPTFSTGLTLGTASTTTGTLTLKNSTNAFNVVLQPGVSAASRTYTWPTDFGAAGTSLTDVAGNGTLSWASSGGIALGDSPAWTGVHTWSTNSTVKWTMPALAGTFTGARTNVAGAGAGAAMTSADDCVILGDAAGDGITTGDKNTAIGSGALGAAASGAMADAVGIGYQAGLVNTANQNVFIGSQAGKANTSGNANVYVGYQAGLAATGDNNLIIGHTAGDALTTGTRNVILGTNAGGSAIGTGQDDNVIIGYNSGTQNEGDQNTFVGKDAGGGNSTGTRNTMIGYQSGEGVTNISDITTIGANAGAQLQAGSNTFVGSGTGDAITTGTRNVFMGSNSGGGASAADLDDNVYIGHQSGLLATTGDQNVFIGSEAGNTVTTGSGNVVVGYNSDTGNAANATCIVIGSGKTGANATGDVLIESNDAGIARVAAGVMMPTNGSRAIGWIQNAGYLQTTADVTNATNTMATVTGLSVTLAAGRKYSFKLVLYVANDQAAEGVKVDFDGGTATMTTFRAHGTLFDTALLLSTQTSAIATDFAVATCTGNAMVEIHGSMTVNAGGTFIVQAAENSDVTGTLTVYKGSHLIIQDMP